MVLAGCIGWSLRFAGHDGLTFPAVLIGMFVAMLVPSRACAVPGEKRPGPAR